MLPGSSASYSRPFINAQARVSIFQQTTADNLEALAVADSAPVAARAYFVNEDNNDAIIASAPLNDLGPNAQGQEMWGNPSGLAVAINKTKGSTANIGVVIALSGNPNDTTCGDPYVQCFDQSTTTGPSLLHIQGWSATGTPSLTAPARPIRRSVHACGKHVQRRLLLEHHDHVHRNNLRVGGLRVDQHQGRHRQAGGRRLHRERIDARGDQRHRSSMDRDDLAQTSRDQPDQLACHLHEGHRRGMWHEHVDVGDDLQRTTSVRGGHELGTDHERVDPEVGTSDAGRELVRGL